MYSPSIERAYGGAKGAAALEQQFEAPGLFADTRDWYRQQLEPKGWRVFNPAETSEGRVEWCRAPWSFTIWRSGDYEGASPKNQFGVRVEWRSWFTSDRCPLRGPLSETHGLVPDIRRPRHQLDGN